MIVGSELRTWIEDRERQQNARRASADFAAEWSRGPIHRRFTQAMSSLASPSGDEVVAALRPVFTDDRWVADLIAALAAPMRHDPYFEPPFRHLNSDIHTGLIVYEDDHVSIAVGVSQAAQLAAKKSGERGRTSIAFSGQINLLKFVKSGDATLSFWSAPEITPAFSAATAGTCARTGMRPIADGEIVTIDGRRQSFVIERAGSNIVLLQATVKPDQAPLSVEYDSATLEYVGCSAADDSASRIQMITTLLRKLGSREAFAAVAEFRTHKCFFVRWHVMRELIGLDATAAVPFLSAMAAHDPHPETRRAAAAALAIVESRLSGLERKAA